MSQPGARRASGVSSCLASTVQFELFAHGIVRFCTIYRRPTSANSASNSRQRTCNLLSVALAKRKCEAFGSACPISSRAMADCPHAGGEFTLRQPAVQASPDQFGRNLEHRCERVVFSLNLGVGQAFRRDRKISPSRD